MMVKKSKGVQEKLKKSIREQQVKKLSHSHSPV